jgi:hypothetical protein
LFDLDWCTGANGKARALPPLQAGRGARAFL